MPLHAGHWSEMVLTKLPPKGAEICLEKPVPILSNLKMHLIGTEGQDIVGALRRGDASFTGVSGWNQTGVPAG